MTRRRRGYASFRKKCERAKTLVTEGKVLAVDPALGTGESMPGYAVYIKGVLDESGSLFYDAETATEGLRALRKFVTEIGPVDVLVVEELRGVMVHPHLHWVVGVLVEAVEAQLVLECPIPLWKRLAKEDPHYVKSDEADAKKLGETVVKLAEGSYPCEVATRSCAGGRPCAKPASSRRPRKTTGPRSVRSKRSSGSRRTKKRSKRC